MAKPTLTPEEIDAAGKRMLAAIDTVMAELKDAGLSHRDACRFLHLHSVFQAGQDDLALLADMQREVTEALEAYSSSEGETLQ